MSNSLTQETIENLCSYQVEKVNRQIRDYLIVNQLANEYQVTICPKCKQLPPQVRKNGKTRAGKQMLQCLHCIKRFVIDHGQLTFYSHQPQSKWNDLLIYSKNGLSLKDSAAQLDVTIPTVFHMRHKLLHFMENMVSPICVEK